MEIVQVTPDWGSRPGLSTLPEKKRSQKSLTGSVNPTTPCLLWNEEEEVKICRFPWSWSESSCPLMTIFQ